MSIRIDPRRLSLLKELAGAEGLRPGQLVQRWVEERLDAERAGEEPAAPTGASRLAKLEAALHALEAQVAALHQPTEEVHASAETAMQEGPEPSTPVAQDGPEAAPRRRGRPRKTAAAAPAGGDRSGTDSARVPLHEEIIAVIAERGPSTAAEIAEAISERGRYRAPRSDRPLDAATVNSRVSNPVYRARFVRSGRRIGLAESA